MDNFFRVPHWFIDDGTANESTWLNFEVDMALLSAYIQPRAGHQFTVKMDISLTQTVKAA